MTAALAMQQQQQRIWQCGAHRLRIQRDRPLVMGILNVTPDSFSDGGRHSTADAAYAHAMQMLDEGADILDIGGESTRPGAAPVPAEEEKRRVLPLTERLAGAGAVVSVDTMKPAVMRAAADAGASILNDVNGFRAADAVDAAAKSTCGLVVMHMQGEPRTMQKAPAYGDVVREVADFLRARAQVLRKAGVAEERLCADPGIGFGKTRAHNLALLSNLPQLAGNLPLLLGISRKSFFAEICGDAPASERDVASAVAAALLLARYGGGGGGGVNILRVHNVQMTRQSIAAWQLLEGA